MKFQNPNIIITYKYLINEFGRFLDMETKLSERKILHYLDIDFVDDKLIKNSVNEGPLVVFQCQEGKHVQVKVSPFNMFNQEKEDLPFTEKLQFYRKKTSNLASKPTEEHLDSPNYTVLAEIIGNYFDLRDGDAQEMAEFNSGIKHPIVTGYEDDYVGFFGNKFVDFNQSSLTEIIKGLQGL